MKKTHEITIYYEHGLLLSGAPISYLTIQFTVVEDSGNDDNDPEIPDEVDGDGNVDPEIPDDNDGDEDPQELDDNQPISPDSPDNSEDIYDPVEPKEELTLKDVIISLLKGEVSFQEALQQITSIFTGN